MKFHCRIVVPVFLCIGGFSPIFGQSLPKDFIYSGYYDGAAFQSLDFVNSVLGWDLFFDAGFLGNSTVIGNVEGGSIWFEHEVFVRDPSAPVAFHTFANTAVGSVNEVDFHATMVGHVLAGSGYQLNEQNEGVYTYVGLGMAPYATLVSGGVATGFSPTNLGEFSTTTESVITAYAAFFQGNLGGVAKPDVINSSWGGAEPAANGAESLAIDGLARQNASVALVLAAGNSGTDAVAWPASGYNNISVGALGGANFLTPSSFSSHGLVDFYNPQTRETITGVRAAVDLAAPGENLYLAAFFGDNGALGASISLASYVQEPSPTDRYFFNQDGTSFAAPIVAGGISLLKDVGKRDVFWQFANPEQAFDTRVVKSALMAGSKATEGWSNGQDVLNVTTQALDVQTGAGSLDLVGAAEAYLFGTRDIAGNDGGQILASGWDMATIPVSSVVDYTFGSTFLQQTTLTVALNWFSVREFDENLQTGTDVAFANLDLQVWLLDEVGGFATKVGESMSTYNNTEFLRLQALDSGNYGLRVNFTGMVYDTTNLVSTETYALAWRAVAVPECSTTALMVLGVCGALLGRRRS